MTATILIVDDLEQNIKLLEAKLVTEYYTILTASSGVEALQILAEYKDKIDIILLDIMMPGMDGFEVCKRIKNNPEISYIPVVMVTALTDIEDRIKGLQAGADEFLTKPISDNALLARVKSLARTKRVIDELQLRNRINEEFGGPLAKIRHNFHNNRIVILDDDIIRAKNLRTNLLEVTSHVYIYNNLKDIEQDDNADLIIISCEIDHDPLRVGVMLRSNPKYAYSVLMMLAHEEDMPMVIKSMDLGINDYFLYPVDASELQARVKTQLKRKLYQDYLRKELEEKVDLSTKDGLTRLFNRRYFDIHVKQMIEKVKSSHQKISLMLLDIDYFKSVNDDYGHQAGDKILKLLGSILKESVRITDLIARYGGEEFAILFDSMNLEQLYNKAEQIRKNIANNQFDIGEKQISITASIGVAEYIPNESMDNFIKRTDEVLYRAKKSGRNRTEKCKKSLD